MLRDVDFFKTKLLELGVEGDVEFVKSVHVGEAELRNNWRRVDEMLHK